MPAQSVDPGIDQWPQHPAVQDDAHHDARQEGQDEVYIAHEAGPSDLYWPPPTRAAISRHGSRRKPSANRLIPRQLLGLGSGRS